MRLGYECLGPSGLAKLEDYMWSCMVHLYITAPHLNSHCTHKHVV